MTKSRITKQEFNRRKAVLTQKRKSLIRIEAEVRKSHSRTRIERAEMKAIGEYLAEIEKEYRELVRGFDEPRISQA